MEDVVEDQELEMKPREPGGEVDATSVKVFSPNQSIAT